METISLAIEINKVESMADKSMKMVVYTQELSPEDMTKLFNFHQKQAFCVIGENPVMEIDAEKLAETMTHKAEGKTPSQRLRGVLYNVWGIDKQWLSFDVWYDREMDKIIDHYKGKIQ